MPGELAMEVWPSCCRMPAGKCVRPLQRAIGGVTLAGIEGAFLAINGDEDNEIVELIAVEVVLLKEIAVTVDDSHGLGVKACGAGEREKEHSESSGEPRLSARTSAADLMCFMPSARFSSCRVLAGVAGVVQLHHGVV